MDFNNFKISVKSSDVFLSVKSYKLLAEKTLSTSSRYNRSRLSFGSIKSSIGLGNLLMDGIGDTIRVSLSDDPVEEVEIGNEILKSIGFKK